MTGPDPAADGIDGQDVPRPEPVGSMAEEAFKLFRAVASTPSAGHASDHVCSTTWCPVCQVVGFVRDHPEAVSSVTQSAADLARSLRNLVDAAMAPKEEQ